MDNNESGLTADHHTEANLLERRALVGRELGLVRVKPSHSSWKIVDGLAASEFWVVMKG